MLLGEAHGMVVKLRGEVMKPGRVGLGTQLRIQRESLQTHFMEGPVG